MNRKIAWGVALATAGLALGLPAAGAAHMTVESLSPKPGSSADRDLGAVRVTFNGAIPDGELVVRSASGTKASRGDGRLVHHRHGLRARLRPGLSGGSYRATVRWLSSDGHVQTKSWSFRLD
jgi:methionine-rich copper-binding protein CopC